MQRGQTVAPIPPCDTMPHMAIDGGLGDESAALEPEVGLVRSAGVLSLGNAASRGLGLVREVVIASYFGATGQVSAFRVASQVPVLLYDFLVGGMLSAALVPVLSEYTQRKNRADFLRLANILITLFAIGLTILVLLLEIFAPQLTWLLAAGFRTSNPELLPLTTRLIRLSAPTVWLLSMAGLLAAILYSLQRFTFPAVATAVYNLGIVIAAPFLAARAGIFSLVFGILAGGLAQLCLMSFDLYQAGVRIRVRIKWRHPALIKILHLYLPVAVGLVVSLFQVGLDRRLASATGDQSIAWMSNATTLQQMPLGLISVAIALAALPKLSQYFARRQDAAYRRTLGRGLRLVFMLIVPAAIILWLLGTPIARLLFQRNRFTAFDTQHVVSALDIYVVGMLCAALDFPLNYAFYARNNTLLPAMVGVLSVGVYIAVALSLVKGWGYLGLVWADSAKQASHVVIMSGLLIWRVGRLRTHTAQGILSVILAAGIMAACVGAVSAAVTTVLPAGFLGDLLLLLLAGSGGLLAYGLTLSLLGMPEIRSISDLIRWRLLHGPTT